MKVKDCHVSFQFDNGMMTGITIQGVLSEWIDTETGKLSLVPLNGKEQFLRDAESKIFLVLGDEAYRYKDINHIWFAETERDIDIP